MGDLCFRPKAVWSDRGGFVILVIIISYQSDFCLLWSQRGYVKTQLTKAVFSPHFLNLGTLLLAKGLRKVPNSETNK